MKKYKINTDKFFLWNLFFFVRYALSGQIFWSIILYSVFSFSFTVNTDAISFPVNISIITLIFVYKFTFDILAETARGNMSPFPNNSHLVSNEVFLKVIFISLMIEMLSYLIDEKGYGLNVKMVFLAIATFIIPAVYMIIAFTDSLMMAFNPLKLFKIIATSFFSYFIFVLFWTGSTLFHELVIDVQAHRYLPFIANDMVSAFFKYVILVINFHIMGYLAFQNRDSFNLEFLGFRNIDENQLDVSYSKINPVHEKILKLIKFEEYPQALKLIEDLQNNGDNSTRLQELKDRVETEQKYNPTNLDIGKRVHKYLNASERRKAFNLVVEQIQSGKQYIEAKPIDISRLIEFAVIINQTKYIPHLVKDFHEKYPYHEDIVRNYFILVKVLYKDRKTRPQAKKLLLELIEKYPNDRHMKEIKAWYKGLKLIEKIPKIVN